MILQEKKILCDTEEPDKNHLWLRPRLDRDGYDLLYFGAEGWTPLIDCSDCPFRKKDINGSYNNEDNTNDVDSSVIEEQNPLFEITPNKPSLPIQGPSCGCPDINN